MENQKIYIERTIHKAKEPIVTELGNISNSLQEIKELLSEVVGILKYMDLNAYGHHQLQKMYENLPDE